MATFSKDLSVTSSGVYTLEMNLVPTGSTVTPVNDIQTWLHCANIWNKNYTTLAQVLADTSTLNSLIQSNNAADYMARSTNWATDTCANQTAMTYIGANNYCANKLLSNSIWCTAICNSTYFEKVLITKVPTMTSNTAPSGQCFVNSYSYSGSSNDSANVYKAFDGNDSTKWDSYSVAGTQDMARFGYKFTNATIVRKVYANKHWSWSGTTYWPASVSVVASNDGTNWTTIATKNTSSVTTKTLTIDMPNSNKAYKYWALYLGFAGYGGGWGSNAFYTVQFYGRT